MEHSKNSQFTKRTHSHSGLPDLYLQYSSAQTTDYKSIEDPVMRRARPINKTDQITQWSLGFHVRESAPEISLLTSLLDFNCLPAPTQTVRQVSDTQRIAPILTVRKTHKVNPYFKQF